MKILVLSSVHPMFVHEKASYIVLASILEAFAKEGHDVQWATVFPANSLSNETVDGLQAKGVRFYGDFSEHAEMKHFQHSGFMHRLKMLSRALFPFLQDNTTVQFLNPAKTVSQLEASGADVFLFFWDTYFEYLLPYMKSKKLIGYFGKPPYEVPAVVLRNTSSKNILESLKKFFRLRFLEHKEIHHLKRLHRSIRVADISAEDKSYYEKHNISCSYIPNTWPDIFGDSWEEKRKTAESKRKGVGILANIGNVNAGGNSMGLKFLGDSVLPLMEECMSDCDWSLEICGQGTLPVELKKKLTHPRVHIRGFVEDIDDEMLGNSILLLVNNAGPVSGGYTRVMYAFSSGQCLIAHRNLALCMPELVHGQNALLGESAEEIVQLLKQACEDANLRRQIGKEARLTYEREYHPKVIAEKIIRTIS